MFRSSIKKRNHIWACLNGCIFSCPDSPWHYCWSPLPLRLCRRHLETADKKDLCGSAAWEQWPQAGRLESLCCGETTVTRLLLRGTPAQREATYGEPVCFEGCPCAFHGGEVWAIKHRSGWYLHGKMMSLVTGGRLLTAEKSFQVVSVEILSFCLENVGSLQITERSEKSNSVNNTLEMRKS